jgi:hypothetical protein
MYAPRAISAGSLLWLFDELFLLYNIRSRQLLKFVVTRERDNTKVLDFSTHSIADGSS